MKNKANTYHVFFSLIFSFSSSVFAKENVESFHSKSSAKAFLINFHSEKAKAHSNVAKCLRNSDDLDENKVKECEKFIQQYKVESKDE